MFEVQMRYPRGFDASLVDHVSLGDTPMILSARHSHLSGAQHEERVTAAAHEASHLLVALLSRTTNFGPYGYIRVPGRTSKIGGKRSVRASVPIGNLVNHKTDMMVSIAGSLFSGMVEPQNDIAGSQDLVDYQTRLAEFAQENNISVHVAEDQIGQSIIDETAAILVKYWQTVDWLATALLLHCNAVGDVKLGPIIEYCYDVPSRLIIQNRSPYFQVPHKHAAYVAALEFTDPTLKGW